MSVTRAAILISSAATLTGLGLAGGKFLADECCAHGDDYVTVSKASLAVTKANQFWPATAAGSACVSPVALWPVHADAFLVPAAPAQAQRFHHH